jgi:sugar lactone lactonase YvrE
MAETTVDCVLDLRVELGECPVWCERSQSLYWIDIYAGDLHRFDPSSGQDRSWPMGEAIGSFALCESEGVILVALKSGIYRHELASGRRQLLASPERYLPHNRMNDGRCDPAGRFWVGTMRDPPHPAHKEGTLYRFAGEGRCTPMVGGIITCNGLAFSPDWRTLYHSDSDPSVRTVWSWDFDLAEGRIENRRVFIDTHGLPGRPDGGCCDADGCYWMTGNDGWELVRLTPAGRIDRRIALPIAKPSMVAFGGRALDTLYVTSIRPTGDLSKQPQAGSLFALRPGVTGIPEPLFKG